MSTQNSLAVALFDYRGSTDEEVSFHQGDTFTILDDTHEEWWFVELKVNEKSYRGYAPKTYLKRLSDQDESVQSSRNSLYENSDDEASIEDNVPKSPSPKKNIDEIQQQRRHKLLKTLDPSSFNSKSFIKNSAPAGFIGSYLAEQYQDRILH